MGATAIAERHAAAGLFDAWAAPKTWEGPAVGGECTLEDVILGAWEELAAHRQIACPVCDGVMMPSRGHSGRYPNGTCLDCGAQLG